MSAGHDLPECPWCHSSDRALALYVRSLRIQCYNDWHLPLCVNCGEEAYSHGQPWQCKRYQTPQMEAEASRWPEGAEL